MKRANENVMGAVVLALVLLLTGRTIAGNLDPTNAPGPTMHTLEEIYQKVQDLAPQTLQTLSPNTAMVDAGYYAATNLTQVDTDLVAGNIATNVMIFGVAGTLSTTPAAVPKTGQTISYAANDDGDYEMGVALPTPRFTVQADTNCVLDNLTGLVWARNADMGGVMAWATAITYCEALDYGGQTDWRLPNAKELLSLIDLCRDSPALPLGHPFADEKWEFYWSSSTYEPNTVNAWLVTLIDGRVISNNKTITYRVWPVRGGQ